MAQVEARWAAREEVLSDTARRYRLHVAGQPLACSEVLALWQADETFLRFFRALLTAAPFAAYRWETPPLSTANRDRAFEFVLLDSPDLVVPADRRPFAAQFAAAPAERDVIDFPNLGGDAQLIVPLPRGSEHCYAHLGAFVRAAPAAQQQALWARVGATLLRRLNARPTWLSTAGGGVAWVHVRLDSRPKYYGHAPYAADRAERVC